MVPELAGRDPVAIINELSHVLHREGCIPDLLAFYQGALNHEMLGASLVGSGLVVPHSRLAGVRQLQFALGRTPEPVVWNPGSESRVDIVFLVAVPATESTAYLHLMAGIARLGQVPGYLEALRRAPDAAAMLASLNGGGGLSVLGG
ncbi:MAG: PTS sugar transporter subunit IIA [Verrucomicrobia bacterium]|jgi:mannitol/fructose-specific phosphotransferase system IIA component (Ntr-type)|nr:PTS sugar transporter subunit IIA [Verrucomicrobiota bacterium]